MPNPFIANPVSAQVIQTELQAAVASATGTRGPKVYEKISAVLFHLEDDDIGCDALEKELAETFRKFYHINNIEHLLIKNEDPYLALARVFVELGDKGCMNKDCLVIFVFSGHGKVDYQFNSDLARGPMYKLMLGGAMKPNGDFRTRALDWTKAVDFLSGSDCDILHIMDCCYAAEAMVSDAEFLAAATETASAKTETCFMNALIQELRRLSSTPFTISTLYQEIMQNRRALKLESMPYYYKRPGRDSIVLGGHRGLPTIPTPKPNSPRVLLSVHVSRTFNMQDLEEWKKWLSNFLPRTVTGIQIKLEGAWDSSSSVLLFSVPITVWAQVGHRNMPFVFVGEVNSSNKLLEQAPEDK